MQHYYYSKSFEDVRHHPITSHPICDNQLFTLEQLQTHLISNVELVLIERTLALRLPVLHEISRAETISQLIDWQTPILMIN